MTPLLGHDPPPGEWISARRAGASWVGEAWFDGIVLFTTWSAADVVAFLPPEWRPAADAFPAADGHPVVFLLGRQRRASILFAGMRLPTDADYDEAMVAVPFAQHRAGRLLHTFIPLMYTSDARATWSGNAHYGFGKRPGAIARFGRSLAVTDERGALVLHVIVHETGTWLPAGNVSVAEPVDALRTLGELPVVGRRADGRDVVSYFGWSLRRAELRSIHASLSIDEAAAPGLVASGGRSGLRGVEVHGLRWRLSWPEWCRP